MSNAKLRPLNLHWITFSIVGTSPLIQHAWSEKGLREMRMTKQERAADKRANPPGPRDKEGEAEAAMHRMPDGSYAVPAVAVKAAIISAAHKDLGIEKTAVRKSLFIPTDNPDGLIRMEADEPFAREDIVRIGQGSTDLRYRPQFDNWRVTIKAQIDLDVLPEQALLNLIDRAGFGNGLGEMRPERGGDYGRFKFDRTQKVDLRKCNES